MDGGCQQSQRSHSVQGWAAARGPPPGMQASFHHLTHVPPSAPTPPADVRVVKSVAAGRGGRVRDEKEAAAAKSITVTSDGREQAAAAAQAAPAPAPAPAAPVAAAAPASGGTPANVAEARAWIDAWKAKSGGTSTAAGNASAAAGGSGAADVAPNVAEAREWIRRWRAASLEKKLPEGAVSQ